VSTDPRYAEQLEIVRKGAAEHPLAMKAYRDTAETDWRGALRKRGERYVGDEANVLVALRSASELVGLVQFDEFAGNVILTRKPQWRDAAPGDPWTDEDDLGAQALLQRLDIDVRMRGVLADSVVAVAKKSPVHPVRDYLDSITWDNTPRLHAWLCVYLGATGRAAYLDAVGRRFLIQAVARIFEPGCQADHVLVLEGKQGIGKSRVARTLAVRSQWFTDSMPDLHSKDAALQLAGRWIIELAELAALRRSDLEGMKAYLTRPVDVYRPPYARRAVAVPRQSVFVASTNEPAYLRDATGNRRFWPVRCGQIDLQALARDRDQLYAEAVAAYRSLDQWHLNADEDALAQDEQAARVLVTELEQQIAAFLERLASQGIVEVTMRSVLKEALCLDPDASDYVERAGRLGPQAVAALDRCGWHRVRTVGRGSHRNVVYRCSQGVIG
jgi:predicted P-loop ATPase